MSNFFNTRGLSQKQRFWRALICGALASIVLLGLYLVFSLFMAPVGWGYSLVYLLIGIAIGQVIRYCGKGVKVSFSIMAAVFCILIIFFGDVLSLFLIYPQTDYLDYFRIILDFYFTADLNSMLSLAARVLAVIAAFQNARVV